ncbi:hypothetical protein L0P78_06240 [Coprococcus eutactus]|jgi:hypothetical protein|uniref:hypothetical protein n=1 Tax=Coprococcus eutactus TaxID=33043 RepID=UPI001EDD9237|nr:hypothetical protein [Coprococcus eutactus]MCG4692624.1 hypothetical protein [Coprococcus eutactus]
MSINFDRNNSQVMYESFIGVDSESLIDKKEEFKNHRLTYEEKELLRDALKTDSLNFFYNGVLSFAEGIDAAFNKRFSWATVELYYSLYYLIRASMASKGIAMLRCKSMYRLFARTGEQPYSTGNKKYNTTHEGTISHYKDLFGQSDILLSNNIEGQDAYQWMMNAREIVNYRSAVFSEPDCLDIWEYFSQSIDEGNFTNVLEQLENDQYVMCFQEEYAVIAVPIKRLQQTISDLLNANLLSDFSEERLGVIKKVIGYEERNLHIMSQIF